MTDLQRRLIDAALRFGSFTLRSGATSDRYFDKYQVTARPELLRGVAEQMATALNDQPDMPTGIVVPALGAVPLGTALSLQTGLPLAIVRDRIKEYGQGLGIEGVLVTDGSSVLVEDVVTSGGAACAALDAARAAGVTITHALCLLDRDGGGREALATAGVQLHALLDHTHIADATPTPA